MGCASFATALSGADTISGDWINAKSKVIPTIRIPETAASWVEYNSLMDTLHSQNLDKIESL
jgi:hypothetical protein